MPESETVIPQTHEEPERLKPVPSDVEASGTDVRRKTRCSRR